MYIIRLAQFILKKRLPPSRGGLGAKGGGGIKFLWNEQYYVV